MTQPSLDRLVFALREIREQNPDNPEPAIETFLARELKALDSEARLTVLGQLEKRFSPAGQATGPGSDDNPAGRLIPLLLGIDLSGREMDSPESLRRMSDSLNTIFTMLNELIGLINTTLGSGDAGEETIRHIIGDSLQGEGRVQSIEEYLSRIKIAFLTAQESSKEAARTIAGQILAELDPKAMESSVAGFKIGPMKKAGAYELFEEKYKRVMKWYDSERFMLDFLRQFEKNCRKSFTRTGGE